MAVIVRTVIVFVLLAATGRAESLQPVRAARAVRRVPLVWTSGGVRSGRPARLVNRLMVGVGVGAGTTETIDQQVRFYALEDLTAGGRIRVSHARVVYEAEVGWAPMRDIVYWFGARARIDYVVLAGLGIQRDLARLPFVGGAVRVHPRTGTTWKANPIDMLACELGVRGTYELGGRADLEVTLGVSVVLPLRF